MSGSVLILGSGRMAQSIGAWLMRREKHVAWWSASSRRRETLQGWLSREIRRIEGENGRPFDPGSGIVLDTGAIAGAAPSIVIECTSEDSTRKQDVIRAWRQSAISAEPLLISTSSSLLPWQIDQECAGCHFFYPVGITRCVEVLIPDTWPLESRQRLNEHLNEWGVTPIFQTSASAFAANRLLLPLQAEMFRLLRGGADPTNLDAATRNIFLPVGQLTLIGRIGLKTVAASVENYRERMSAAAAAELHPLSAGIAELIASQGDRSIAADRLPWAACAKSTESIDPAQRFLALFINTCHWFLHSGQVLTADLAKIFSSVYLNDVTPAALATCLAQDVLRPCLQRLYAETGCGYFNPVH
jgi:3-hydroxyacyl-CoA dehydrogenase